MDTCMWVGVDLRMDTTKHMLKRIDLHAQNMLTILGSIINMMGGLVRPLNERIFFHFDSE